MSKYQPLENYLKNIKHDQIDIKFAEIEQLLGFHLPASSRDHRAWWSNNSSNNVMTHAWVNAGFVTESVDMASEKLVFKRVNKHTHTINSYPSAIKESQGNSEQKTLFPKRSTLFGALKGMLKLNDKIDFTAPTSDEWEA